MVHNILYCKEHDKFFHGFRPIGMHNRLHDIPHWQNPEWLVDMGFCPFYQSYSIQTNLHELYKPKIDRVIRNYIDLAKEKGLSLNNPKWGNWR